MWDDAKYIVYGTLIIAAIATFVYNFPYLSAILVGIILIGLLIVSMGMCLFLLVAPYFDRARGEEREQYRNACEDKKDTIGDVYCNLLNRKLDCSSTNCKFYNKGK